MNDRTTEPPGQADRSPVPRRRPSWRLLGIVLICVSEGATLLRIQPFAQYNTPIDWTGYILFADGLVLYLTGRSLIRGRPREFVLMVIWSIPAWLIFEGYNLYLRNWHYVGLLSNPALAAFSFAWAFATILPGVLETVDLLAALGVARGAVGAPLQLSGWAEGAAFVVGLTFVVVPLVLPGRVAQYTFALVWIGFVLVLEPILHRFGGRSLIRQLAAGDYRRLIRLIIAGAICGFLWESWNYWASAKWIYDVPAPLNAGPHVFEMPILGFIGFLPYAVECEALQNFAVLVARRAGIRIEPAPADFVVRVSERAPGRQERR